MEPECYYDPIYKLACQCARTSTFEMPYKKEKYATIKQDGKSSATS